MNICVVGTGYVGLVTGAVFADLGNDVVCVDKLREKIDSLRAGGRALHERRPQDCAGCAAAGRPPVGAPSPDVRVGSSSSAPPLASESSISSTSIDGASTKRTSTEPSVNSMPC